MAFAVHAEGLWVLVWEQKTHVRSPLRDPCSFGCFDLVALLGTICEACCLSTLDHLFLVVLTSGRKYSFRINLRLSRPTFYSHLGPSALFLNNNYRKNGLVTSRGA